MDPKTKRPETLWRDAHKQYVQTMQILMLAYREEEIDEKAVTYNALALSHSWQNLVKQQNLHIIDAPFKTAFEDFKQVCSDVRATAVTVRWDDDRPWSLGREP